jgi:hypothetical protein
MIKGLAVASWHNKRLPQPFDLTLIDPDGKLGRDVAIMRADIEELRAKLARMPAVIARAALSSTISKGFRVKSLACPRKDNG